MTAAAHSTGTDSCAEALYIPFKVIHLTNEQETGVLFLRVAQGYQQMTSFSTLLAHIRAATSYNKLLIPNDSLVILC